MQNREQVVANARLVVIHITGRKYRDFPRRALTVADLMASARGGLSAKRAGAVGRQLALRMNADCLFHERARGGIAVDRVHNLRHDRDGGELADGIGGGEQPVSQFLPPFPEFDRLGAQHQVREIHVPGMRRHVRAFRHVAHIAEVALVHDLPELRLLDAVDFEGCACVHEIEERRKRRAQVDAAAAAMTDTEYALELGEQLFFVVEIRKAPFNRMAGRGFQAAFADGHLRTFRIKRVNSKRRGSGSRMGFSNSRTQWSARGVRNEAQSASASSAFWKRLACERSALARVSNQSAISEKPS